MRARSSQRGSAVLVALLVVLGVGSAVIALTGHVMAVEEARLAQARANEIDSALESGLAQLLARAGREWGAVAFELSGGGRGSLEPTDCPDQLWARVEVRQGTRRAWRTAVLERALDGLDLPPVALAAARAVWEGPREVVPVYPAPGEAQAPVAVSDGPGGGGAAGPSSPGWNLDRGSRLLVSGIGPFADTGAAVLSVLLPGASERAAWAHFEDAAPETPRVAIALDRDLDARGRGDLHGVLVCEGGDVLLEGTTVHGAVLCSGTVDFGGTGAVRWAPGTFWAVTDSLYWRYRFVPGSFGQGVADMTGL